MREYQRRRGGNLNRKPEIERAYLARVGTTRSRYPEMYRQHDQLRRARKVAADVEMFADREVFDRDGWQCGICSGPVDAAIIYPDPMSPSLDHVVPLSLGGAHTRANTRLAHLTCNIKRGNRAA